MPREDRGEDERDDIEQSEFAAASLQVALNNLVGQSAQIAQNAITVANTLANGAVANALGVMGDDRRLAREVEPMEAMANRLISEVVKLPTADYLIAFQSLIDMLLEKKPEA